MMNSCAVAELTQQINDKISAIRRMLELRTVAKDQDKRNILLKLGRDIIAINGLLDNFEMQVHQQRDMLKCLKELEGFFQEDLRDGQHLKDNMPPHMPRKGMQTINGVLTQSKQVESQQPQQQNPPKNPHRNQIREMTFITTEEFESVPQYMKGRVTYNQLNAAVQSINTAVMEKYTILQQPAKNMSNVARKLYQRFKDEETKDTKGQFFVVEADIREFTQLKVDKRFHAMLNMLRHCQRLRELRGGGLTRYLLL